MMLAPGRYGFDDVEPGTVIETGKRSITAEMIDAFADLTGDRFEIHTDREAAQQHGFTDRVAHGLLVLSVVDGLKNLADAQFKARASLGWDWSFKAPVLAGDEIGVRIEVIEKRATSKADQGILKLVFSVTNQHGIEVQKGWNQLLVYR